MTYGSFMKFSFDNMTKSFVHALGYNTKLNVLKKKYVRYNVYLSTISDGFCLEYKVTGNFIIGGGYKTRILLKNKI